MLIATWAIAIVVFGGLSTGFYFMQSPIISGMMLGGALIATLNLILACTMVAS